MEFTASIIKRRIVEALDQPGPPVQRTPRRAGDSLDVRSLLTVADDAEFLREAYRQMFEREADAGGFAHYRELLRDRYSRTRILRQLAESKEGKATGIRYVGLTDGRAAYRGMLGPVTALRSRALGYARRAFALLLRASRMEALELKLDYLINESNAAAGRQSAEFNQAFYTLSGKFDAYVADVIRKEDELHGAISKLKALNAARYRRQVRQTRELASLLQAESTTLAGFIEQSAASHRTNNAALEAGIEELTARVDRSERVIENLIERSMQSVATSQKSPVFRAGENIVVVEVDGFILGVPGEEWRLAAYLALRGMPEPGTVKLFNRLIEPNMTVVDVGAHVGIYTLHALRKLDGKGKVFSFEPTPRSFTILADNIQVNGFKESGMVQLMQAAVSGAEGTARLTLYNDNSGHNTLYGHRQSDSSIQVETVSLDHVLEREPRVDLVKIDAEGAEPRILHGMHGLWTANPEMKIIMEFAPEHLKRAGVDPLQWGNQLQLEDFLIQRIDDVSGELLPVSSEELASCVSWNVLLTHSADS